VRLRGALRPIASAADVVVTAMQRFEETKYVVGGFFGACASPRRHEVGRQPTFCQIPT
jgi:hypothetical protein